MDPFSYSKSEKAAVTAAFEAIEYLCGCTNWSDPARFREAFHAERAEMRGATAAKVMVVKAWHEGASNPDRPIRDIVSIDRAGYLGALMLGARHAVERADSDYTGPLFRKALELCPAAIAAHEAVRERGWL